MITIMTTIFDPAGKTPLGQIARQGCSWGAFRPGQAEPFFYGSSRNDAIAAVRADAAERRHATS